MELTFHWRKYCIVDSSEFCGKKRSKTRRMGGIGGDRLAKMVRVGLTMKMVVQQLDLSE